MAHEELAWLFHEPHIELDDCLNMLLSCFRKMMSDSYGQSCKKIMIFDLKDRDLLIDLDLLHDLDQLIDLLKFVLIFDL